MAFGKNPEQLGRVVPYGGNLSQRARHLSNARQNRPRGGGGGAPYWKDTFKVPTNHARFGRLIPGQYVQEVSFDDQTVEQVMYEYVMFKEHYMGGQVGRGGICSAGPLFRNRSLRNPCHGCDIFWEDYSIRSQKRAAGDRTKGPNRISMRDMYAFTWWDYGLWYNAPRKDGQGRTVVDQQGQPRMDWVMGQENDPRYAGCESKYGHLIAWPMGETYKDTLLSNNDYIMQDCANCGTRGAIQFISRNCANCGGVVYDTNTTLTPEQRAQIDNNPHQCQCGFNGYPIEVVNCSACGAGKRASIFDVDLQITSVGTKGQQTFLQILNRSEPRPIQVEDPQILASIQPLDLLAKFKPAPLDKQAEWWGTATAEDRNPAPPVQAQVHQQPMYQPPQQPVYQAPPPAAPNPLAPPQPTAAAPTGFGGGQSLRLPGMQPAPGFAPPAAPAAPVGTSPQPAPIPSFPSMPGLAGMPSVRQPPK